MDSFTSPLDFDIDLTNDYLSGGRQVILSNASTIVSILSVAIGAFFIIAAIILIAVYVTGIGGGSSNFLGRSLDHQNGDYFYSTNRRSDKFSEWVHILQQIEEAFGLYGLETKDRSCKRRLVCEAYKKNALHVNREVALHLSSVIGKLTPKVTHQLTGADKLLAHELLSAANDGRNEDSCDELEKKCPSLSLKTVSRK